MHADSVTLQNGAFINAQTTGAGNAGKVTIATDSLTVDSSVISADTFGGGNAGGVEIQSGSVSVTGALIGSSATDGSSGNAGSVQITATDRVSFSGSTIQSISDLAGNSGDIFISSPLIELESSSALATSATGHGSAGTITLQTNNLSMNNSAITSSVAGEGQGGTVTVIGLQGPGTSAHTITMSNESQILTETINTENNVPGEGAAGSIDLSMDQLSIITNSKISAESRFSRGNAGDITITAGDQVVIASNSEVSSRSTAGVDPVFQYGSAGSITLTAPSVVVTGGGFITANTETNGAGGAIGLNVGALTLSNGGHLTTGSVIGTEGITPTGTAGNVTIQGLSSPAQSVLIDGTGSGIFTDTQGTGAGGNVTVNAASLTIQNGGTLSAATAGTAPSATGGTITVNAEQVALSNHALITAESNGIAPAGVVEINTGSLAINGGSQIRSSSGAETPVVASLAAAPTLTGGTIKVQGRTGAGSQADSVSVDGAGSGLFTETAGRNPGGDINITASQSVTMTNGATMSASSTGQIENPGNAGSIDITAMNGFTMQNSTITTQAGQGASGGNIKVTTSSEATVLLQNSTMSASVADGPGGGGNISIDPQYVILQNSQILAQAAQGQGGAITITAGLFLPDGNSVVNADSGSGLNGTVTIQSPLSQAGGKIVPLSQKPLIATSLLNQRCAALAGGQLSSFTVAGRDSLPAEPGSWLSSPLATLNAGAGPEPKGEGVALGTSEGDAMSRLSGLSSPSSLSGRSSLSGLVRTRIPYDQIDETDQTNQIDQTNEINQTNQPVLSLRKIAPPGFLTQTFAVDWSAGCSS
jgi:large exoprotein involved in heme utilization and adhesion